MRMIRTHQLACYTLAGVLCWTGVSGASAQLFDHLEVISNRIRVGSPEVRAKHRVEGPKGIVLTDLDLDGHLDFATSNLDGTVSIGYGLAGREFEAAVHLETGGTTLREIVAVDLDKDGREELVVADPVLGEITIFSNTASRQFVPSKLATWQGARNFAAADLDSDGFTDLIVTGAPVGVRLYRGDGAGGFLSAGSSSAPLDDEKVQRLIDSARGEHTARPVFTLRVYEPLGGDVQVLITHAYAEEMFVYGVGAGGMLESHGLLQDEAGGSFEELHHFELGAVTSATTGAAAPDIVGASKRRNTVYVWKAEGTQGSFGTVPHQTLRVEGGPRAVRLADIDGDGWNDLVVAQRFFDRLSLFRNVAGQFEPWTTLPTGASPRDLAVGDVDKDGHLDVAVASRLSSDVATHFGDGGGQFELPTRLYQVDGDAGGLLVTDLDADGFDDVVQMHRATGDVSVRLSTPSAGLGAVTYYPMGVGLAQVTLQDANDDGIADLTSANMGAGSTDGSFSYRPGSGDGLFGNLTTVSMPPSVGGRVFAVRYADFDGDGITDLVAGYYDCRVTFFKGEGDGGFVATRTHYFVSEARLMATGDFDSDGDIDLAGASAVGSVVVFENQGNNMMQAASIPRLEYDLQTHRQPGVHRFDSKHLDDDGDLDLFLVTSGDVFVLKGRAGVGFELQPEPLLVAEGDLDGNPPETGAAAPTVPSVPIGISAAVVADFDGDGTDDLATGCRDGTCINIHTQASDGSYLPALSVDVPSAGLLATGDLDGDGQPDLVGSGEVLWVAYSSRAPVPTTVIEPNGERGTKASVVINELLAANDSIPIVGTGGSGFDVVELYNGSGAQVDLSAWRLRLELLDNSGEVTETKDHSLPTAPLLEAGGHRVIVCAGVDDVPTGTGFKLPRSGGRLILLDSAGAEIDSLTYPEQEDDISFARYRDGFEGFVFNPYPDPGAANLDNGGLEPSAKLLQISPLPAPADTPLLLTARASDDQAIESLTVVYRRLDERDDPPVRVALFDDGLGVDDVAGDGRFASMLPALPDGAEIEFYMEAVDLAGDVDVDPVLPAFSRPGEAIFNYSLVVGSANTNPTGVEISEIASANNGQVLDPFGDADDWIELRNTSGTASLAGFALFQEYFDAAERYDFGDDEVLAGGAYRLVWADSDREQGDGHLPFKISAGGEDVYLGRRTPLGAMAVVEAILTPEMVAGESFARAGAGGPFRRIAVTPGDQNINREIDLWHERETGEVAILYRMSETGTSVLETTIDAAAGAWLGGDVHPPSTVERLEYHPAAAGAKLYRVRRE